VQQWAIQKGGKVYGLINKYAEQTVQAAEDRNLIQDYEWLCQNPNHAEFERRHRRFWVMGGAHLNAHFYPAYFGLLNNIRNGEAPADIAMQLTQVTHQLYEASTDNRGRRSIQFSFATKLMHTVNPHLPIYDSMVAEFFFFQRPTNEGTEERIGDYIAFYNFLIDEYNRILRQGLLTRAIGLFRSKCTSQHWTDEKIIDSLIWAFVPLLRDREIEFA
jgi:hypothetical protein